MLFKKGAIQYLATMKTNKEEKMIGIKWLRGHQFDNKYDTAEDKENPKLEGYKAAKDFLQRMQRTGLSVSGLEALATENKLKKI